MIRRYALALLLVLSFGQTASAVEPEETAEFVARIEECMRLYNPAAEAHRRECLKDLATIHLRSAYRRAARDRLWSDFNNDFPDLGGAPNNLHTIAAAIHWKDLPYPNPESREYLLLILSDRTSSGLVAHLKRSHGQSIDHQVAAFLEGKFDFDRDFDDLYALKTPDFFAALKKKAPPVGAFMAAFAMDDMITDGASCPALRKVDANLAALNWPLPKRGGGESKTIVKVVLHPHIVRLRVPDNAFSITVEDHSMATEVYRWVSTSAEALEPCWRDRIKPPVK